MEQKKSLKEIDILFYIHRYWNLFWRWKWFIMIACPLIALGAVVYVFKFASPKPELAATIVIGFEGSPANEMLLAQDAMDISKMDLIRSRTLLSEVVQKLSLNLILHDDIPRSAVFDSVVTDSTALVGKYEFEIDEVESSRYRVLFTNKKAGIHKRVVHSGSIPSLDSINLQGIHLEFSPDYLKAPHPFSFAIVRSRDAVELIRSKLVLPKVDRRTMGSDFAYISLLGRDYELLTKTVNTIGDEFVARNLSFKKRKTSEVIATLGKQLEAAALQLKQSDSAVQVFMERNPQVGLGVDARSVVDAISQLESSKYVTSLSGEESRVIRKRLNAASGEGRELLINEALIFLSNQNVPAAMALQAELNQAMQRRAAMELNYSKDHPLYKEAEGKIASAGQKIEQLLLEYENRVESQVGHQQARMGEYSQRLQGLPLKERLLAELERRRQVTSQIHSTVLSRYNQAKIADAVEVADMYIMDYAIPPEAPSDLMNKLKMLAIGFGIAFAFSFGIPVLFDMLDKTARTEDELQHISGLPVLESIPVIRISRQNKATIPNVDSKLITAGFSSNYVDEFFRMLRAKIFMRLDSCEKKGLLISSYDAGDGKSLLASNLAVVTAQQKLRTLLIDGDTRRGILHKTFLAQKKPGLTTLLSGDEELSEDLVKQFMQQTHVPNLHLLSSGPIPPNPSELLSSRRFEALITILYSLYDVILMDTPPLAAVADAAIVGKHFSGYVLAVKAGETNNVALKKKVDEYSLRGKVIGLVLNQAELEPKLKYYRYSSYLQGKDASAG